VVSASWRRGFPASTKQCRHLKLHRLVTSMPTVKDRWLISAANQVR
jgi:hypothetical protein